MNLRHSIALFRGQREFHTDIIGKRRWWFLISAALIVISLGGLFVRHLNLGIDFRGGSQLTYDNRTGVDTDQVLAKLAALGHTDAVVQIIDDPRIDKIDVRTDSLGDRRGEIVEALAAQAGIQSSDVNAQIIGPKWGQQISKKALQGLIIFLIVVSIYIAFRFEWKMSAAALIALFHDLIITAGVYALTGREVTPETVIAILTILGYSLYDTVVIFDKVKENAESQALVLKETYSGTVNMSLNQVMMRSVNTSLVVLLPIGTLLFLGGDTLKNFAFALFVGVALGAYSSIFLAAPVLAVFKEREPRMTQIRERAVQRGGRPLRPLPSPDGEKRELTPAGAGTKGQRAAGASSRSQGPGRRPKKESRAKRKKR